jgi:regulator of sirC expression with transglutaminase-like and TPR domain
MINTSNPSVEPDQAQAFPSASEMLDAHQHRVLDQPYQYRRSASHARSQARSTIHDRWPASQRAPVYWLYASE